MSKFPYLPKRLEQYLPPEYYDDQTLEYEEDDAPYSLGNYLSGISQNGQNQEQPQPQPQQRENPYYNGIRAAISEARESFVPTKQQSNRALRQGILKVGESLGGMERERGFKNNLLSAGRALSPAITAYDEANQANENANQSLADKILAYQAAEEAKKVAAEKEAYNREFAREQFEEQKNLHRNDLTLNGQQPITLAKYAKINTPSTQDTLGKQVTASASFYEEAEKVKQYWEDLKSTLEQNGINVNDPLILNETLRDFNGILSSFTQDPVKREIAKKYSTLKGANKLLMQTAEKAKKNGALTDFTVKYGENNKLFPTLSEGADVFEHRLNELLKDAKDSYDASDYSARSGYFINSRNLNDFRKDLGLEEQSLAPKTLNTKSADEWVAIKAPSGRIEEVHRDDVAKILNNPGYEIVK